jgi:hypothetical protein
VANSFESGISGVQPKVMLPDAERSMSLSDRATVVHSNLIVKATTDELHVAKWSAVFAHESTPERRQS